MTVKKTFLFCICLIGLATSCCNTGNTDPGNDADTSWKTTLEQKLPLLGHRNWIVVTDMAYPLQTNPGITTLYAEEPYADVISTVDSLIGQAPHVFAHVYQDQEQTRLSEALAPGWDEYKESVSKVLGTDDVKLVPHEELIKRLLLIISDFYTLSNISQNGHKIYIDYFSPDAVSKILSITYT